MFWIQIRTDAGPVLSPNCLQMLSADDKSCHSICLQKGLNNSADPGLISSEEAVGSGSSQFAILHFVKSRPDNKH